MITAVFAIFDILALVVIVKVWGLWRWLSGHTHNGYHHTNASWTRRSHGERPVLHPTGNAIRWHHLPRLYRAGIRTGGTLGYQVILLGLITGTALTLAFLTAAAAGCLTLGGWWAWNKVRNWRHNRDWVKPFDLALPPEVSVGKLARDRTSTTLNLAPGLVADDKFKQLVLLTAAAKLALPVGDLKPDWSKMHGKKPEVVITLVPPPPGYVSFGDIKPYADDAEEHQIVFGLGRKSVPVVISVDKDSPHLGASMSSGDGKSVTCRNAACQLAHHGALVVVLDTKMLSQHWAAGLPNVAYARTPAELHELALWLGDEIDRRFRVALYSADVEGKVHANVGARIVGILEELNATQSALQTYWKEELDGKGKSPAVVALDKVSFTGRQANVNLIYIGQRLSAKAVSGGSGDARENLGVLLMRNPAASTWKMLVGDRHALPPATDVDGRLQIVTAKEVTEVQGAYVTGAQAREYATSGIVAEPRKDMPCVGGLAPVGTPEREAMERAAQNVRDNHAIEGHGPDLHIVPDSPGHSPLPPPRITIPQAIEEQISGPTYEAVRKALARDRAAGKPVPEPVGRNGNADMYDRVEWCDWEEARRQPRRLVR